MFFNNKLNKIKRIKNKKENNYLDGIKQFFFNVCRPRVVLYINEKIILY